MKPITIEEDCFELLIPGKVVLDYIFNDSIVLSFMSFFINNPRNHSSSGRWGGEGQRWMVRWRGAAMHIDLANVDWRERQGHGGLGEKGFFRWSSLKLT
jgi:hypothetical protein